MILFYDTETTGLPIDYKAHVHDVDNWPRLVQLAWKAYTDYGTVLCERNHLIYPSYADTIGVEAREVHGLSYERLEHEGVNIIRALVEFQVAQELCSLQVGHNVNFDRKVVGAEAIRHDMEHLYQRGKAMSRFCTMFKTMKYVGAPKKTGKGVKWPTLQELYYKCFDVEFDDQHDASADVEATAKSYFHLIDKNIVERPEGGFESA